MHPTRERLSRVAVLPVAGAVAVLLVATSWRYGYHRDELYFLVLGDHPAWGYPDQPPLVPVLAGLVDAVAPDSLVALRVLPALATAGTVLLTGATAAVLGARWSGQLVASASMAVGAVTLAAGHLMSTTAFDLLCWAAVLHAVVRGVRDERAWLVAGLAAGVGLQVKSLMAFLLVALAVGLLLAGPRRLLRSPWLWGGVALALVLALPSLLWQATHGWPQLEMSAAIADGSSGTSASRWVLAPFQLLLLSPFLAPVWLCGLVRLLRTPGLRPVRFVGVAYLVLLVGFTVAGGKPYYLAGFFPVLLAAGGQPVADWLLRARARLAAGGAALALSLAFSTVVFLPTLPVRTMADLPVVDVNYDAGETVGWPRFAVTVASTYFRQPDRVDAVVLTGNYGELGALARYSPNVPAYSGHNGLAALGPPPATTDRVVAVGFSRSDLERWFRVVRTRGRVDNGVGVDNDEQGTRIWLCRGPRARWSRLWPEMTHLG